MYYLPWHLALAPLNLTVETDFSYVDWKAERVLCSIRTKFLLIWLITSYLYQIFKIKGNLMHLLIRQMKKRLVDFKLWCQFLTEQSAIFQKLNYHSWTCLLLTWWIHGMVTIAEFFYFAFVVAFVFFFLRLVWNRKNTGSCLINWIWSIVLLVCSISSS